MTGWMEDPHRIIRLHDCNHYAHYKHYSQELLYFFRNHTYMKQEVNAEVCDEVLYLAYKARIYPNSTQEKAIRAC